MSKEKLCSDPRVAIIKGLPCLCWDGKVRSGDELKEFHEKVNQMPEIGYKSKDSHVVKRINPLKTTIK